MIDPAQWFFAGLFFGFFAGMAGAAVVLVWHRKELERERRESSRRWEQ